MIVSYFDLKLHLCLVIDWSDSKGVRIFSIPSEVEYARDHGVIQTGENVCSLVIVSFSTHLVAAFFFLLTLQSQND